MPNPPLYSRKYGAGMIIVFWIMFVGLMVVVFDDILEEQNNPNQNVASTGTSNFTEVQLRQNRFGHYIARGWINGNSVDFLIDTGATTLSIPEHIARRISLKKGRPRRASTANGIIQVYDTKLDSVQLGDIIIRNVSAGINPYMRENEVLLGMSFLRKLELEQKDGKLTLRQNH